MDPSGCHRGRVPQDVFTDRLGRVSFDQLQAALARFDLGRLIMAEAATTGNF